MNSEQSPKVIQAAAWYTVSNFMVRAMSFLTVSIFSRLMTKREFGDFSNFNVWVHLLSMAVFFALPVSINRARFDYPNQLREYSSSILLGCSGLTACFYALVCWRMEFFQGVFSLSPFYIHVMFLYLLMYPSLDIFQNVQRVQYRYKISSALSLGAAVGSTVVSVILVLFMKDRFLARVMGLVVPTCMVFLACYFYILWQGRSFRLSYFRYAFLYSWPFVPHSLSNYVLAASDRLMIERFSGSEDVAVYTIACNCASIASLFLTSLNTAVAPWVFEKLDENDKETLYRFTFPYMAVFLFPMLLILLLAPEAVWIMGGRAYAESLDCVTPLLISVVIQFAYCMYVNVEQYSKKTWAIATGTMIAASVNVGLNYYFIPRFGYQVAAYTTLTGYGVLFAVHFIFVRMLGYKKVYNDKLILLILGIALLVQPLLTVLYRLTVLRYSITIAYCGISAALLYRNRETLLPLLTRKSA